MIRKRLARIATAILTAGLLGAMTVAAPASAATPGWEFRNVQQLPPTVADGALAGFSFRIFNSGRSNISALYLTDTVVAAPEYLWNSRGTVCQRTPDLFCSFGALNAQAFIDVTIAYRVGTTDFSNTFKLDSTGNVVGGNNSHGDSKLLPLTTNVSTSSNFDGGFVVGSQSYSTNQSVGRSNKQASAVSSPASLIPVTIADGITTGVPCTVAQCSNKFGEWTELHVNNGATFGAPFKVTLLIWGGAVPTGVAAGDIVLLHTLDNGTTVAIANNCTPSTGTPTNAECRTVTKVGKNYQIVAWLFQNGNLRGGY